MSLPPPAKRVVSFVTSSNFCRTRQRCFSCQTLPQRAAASWLLHNIRGSHSRGSRSAIGCSSQSKVCRSPFFTFVLKFTYETKAYIPFFARKSRLNQKPV